MSGKQVELYALGAEVSVLGACLHDPEYAVPECLDILSPDNFYNPDHRTIYEAIVEVYGGDSTPDAVTVSECIRNHGGLPSKNDPLPAVAGFLDTVVTAEMVADHANVVRDKATLRKLARASEKIQEVVQYPDGSTAQEKVTQAESIIFDVGRDSSSSGWVTPADRMMDVFAKVEEIYAQEDGIIGLRTGFPDIDRMTGGLKPGNLIIVAGRPAMGKTSWTLNVATYAALREDANVAMFSLEMTEDELVQRILFSEARTDMNRLIEGRMDGRHWEALNNAAGKLNDANLFIEDSGSLSILEAQAKARRLDAMEGVDMLVFDYIQLMHADAESRVQEVSSISRGLKSLAKELDAPVIGVSQLSRAPEKRSDPRPVMSDLRESGQIEQDADIVSFLYRPSYYDDQDDPDMSPTEVIVAKQRNGPTGAVDMIFDKSCTRFESAASLKDERMLQ